MTDYRKLKEYLLKDKRSVSNIDDFIASFYNKLKKAGKECKPEKFDDFLTELYIKDDQIYGEWLKIFSTIPYSFVSKNVVLVTYLVCVEQQEAVKTIYVMQQRKNSILSKYGTVLFEKSTVAKKRKELLKTLEDRLKSMNTNTENDILRKAQNEFANQFEQYSDDPYIGSFYNEMLNDFEKELISKINSTINLIINYSNEFAVKECDNASFEDAFAFKKSKRCIHLFKQTRY